MFNLKSGFNSTIIKHHNNNNITNNKNKFEKISKEQFTKDMKKNYINTFMNDTELLDFINIVYNDLKSPRRATINSAGYDFFAPFNINLSPNESILIPTGIKCNLNNGAVLLSFPRSSLGFKFNLTLANTIGVIDADYYNNNKNEGHIFIKFINGKQYLNIKKGDAFCQMIIMNYLITVDDNLHNKKIRNGGIGSTNE